MKNHYPFFDMAYQGFASGDMDRDAKAIGIFLEDDHEIACTQYFSKIMGLYWQRVGCLRWVRIIFFFVNEINWYSTWSREFFFIVNQNENLGSTSYKYRHLEPRFFVWSSFFLLEDRSKLKAMASLYSRKQARCWYLSYCDF